MSDVFSIAGRVALVTGSTRGIGRAIAYGFAAAGARVYLHGRAREQGEKLAHELNATFILADLSCDDGLEHLASTIASAETCLDILVNNAGVEQPAAVADLDPESLRHTLRVNLEAPVRLTGLLLPLLRKSGSASVINIGSIHEKVPYRGNSAYSASKAGLAMFTKTLALELASDGVRVNALAPGAIETDINRAVLDAIGRDRFAEWIPLGRVGEAEELVGPAIFLASSASSYMTGATIVADGGYRLNLVRYQPQAHPGP